MERPKNLPAEREDAKFPLSASRSTEAKVDPEAEDANLQCPPEPTWEDLVGTLRKYRRQLLRIPGVTAVDVGYRYDEQTGKFADNLTMRVHVERKQPIEYFKDREHELICKSEKTPKTASTNKIKDKEYISPGGKPVKPDVIEAKYCPAAMQQRAILERPRTPTEFDRRRRLDPLVGGISIGSPDVPVGTLGALVWDKIDGAICILSNWHVLAGNLHAEAGSPCFQPGRFDQGRSSDVVARLKRWSFDNQTDAAIAELTGSRRYCAGEIIKLNQQITGTKDPHLGMVVQKSGRTTDVTWGFIDGLFFSTTVQYSNGVVRVFEDQIHIAPLPPEDDSMPISPISDSGDSGAVWVTSSNGDGYQAIGLHFAGDLPRSAFGEYALANPIKIIEERLKFSFRPRFLEIRDDEVAYVSTLPATQSLSPRGNGAQPLSVTVSGLTGTSGQPEDDKMGSGN